MSRSPFLPMILFASLLAGCPQGSASTAGPDAGDAGDAGPDASSPGSAIEGAPSDSALCGANGEDLCPTFTKCDPALGCVECSTDDDCPATADRCLEGKCVGCRPPPAGSGDAPDAGLSDCPEGSACWTSDYACHAACSRDNPCPEATRCDELSGACVGCSSDAECNGQTCSPVLRRCVECAYDDDCPVASPRCRRLVGKCVACTANEDCGVTAPICDPITFACRTGCSSDEHCPGQRCDLASAKCVDVEPDGGSPDGGANDDAGAPTDAGDDAGSP